MSLQPEVRRGGNLPFGMVASRWMCDPRYSTNARTLYAILVSYADTHSRGTQAAKPYRKELAVQLGVHLATLDRTLDELEVAGLVSVERRVLPGHTGLSDANVYHLHDAGVMWQGNGTWADPLPPGATAAEVAKARTEARRRGKREAGVVRKGGVAKGVNTRAGRISAEQHEEVGSERGGSTHAATPKGEIGEGDGSTGAARGSSTDAASVAAPVLPFKRKNPVQNPCPDAPSARSAADARRASHLGQELGGEGGVAASGAGTPADTIRPGKRTPLLTADVAQVLAAYPAELVKAVHGAAGTPAPRGLISAIRDQLAERTAEQLAERVARRWHTHGHAIRHADGVTDRPVGVAIALVRAGECGHARCEDGVDLDSGTPCRACGERRTERTASRPNQTQLHTTGPAPKGATANHTHRTNGRCPGCGLPGTHGERCAACRHRDAEHDDTPPKPTASAVPAPRAAVNPAPRQRCPRCRSRTGRSHWGGLCGPCRAAG